MDLQGVQHTLPGHNDLPRLLINRQCSDQRSHLLRSLPLGQLAKSLLTCPGTRVDDLQVQLAVTRVEDEYSPVDRLGRQVALEGLVDGNSVDVSVVHEPNDLVREQFRVVLGVQVRFGRFG